MNRSSLKVHVANRVDRAGNNSFASENDSLAGVSELFADIHPVVPTMALDTEVTKK